MFTRKDMEELTAHLAQFSGCMFVTKHPEEWKLASKDDPEVSKDCSQWISSVPRRALRAGVRSDQGLGGRLENTG